MDRRQRKTREAIFHAFSLLLSQKDFSRITVGQIIDKADVGRTTFYAHFETKDQLLEAFCQELFCHIFDTESKEENAHRHIFTCGGSDDVFLHLIQHLQKNDNNILALLSSENNELFLRYFRDGLERLIESHLHIFAARKPKDIPDSLWKNYILSTFIETVKWSIANGMTQTPETITSCFFRMLGVTL